MQLDAERIIRWRIRWENDPRRCKCEVCNRAMRFADDYLAVKGGAPFKPEMLNDLSGDMYNAFIELICLRSI
jgi:hypothetical protein